MKKDINQTISQFLDDELDHAELDVLLSAIKNEPELKQQINRYQVMTQVLTDERGLQASPDFLDKINQQIKQEPHYLLPKKVVKKRMVPLWQKASFAVAASVACVAVIMSQQSDFQLTQVLTDERGLQASPDFLDKINQQIKQEPHYLLPKKVVKKRVVPLWQKASFAVAASVACVAVIMSQQSDFQLANQFQQVQVAAVDTKVIENPIQETEKEVIQPSQHERFKAYLQAHNDDLYTHGSLNVHPLARTASYR